MKSKSWSWHMWAAKTSSLPRPVERSSSERLPKCNEVTEPETTMGTNGQSTEIEDRYLYECLKPRWLTSKNWACLIANPSKKIPAPNLIVLHQWSIIFKYLICISHFSLLSSPLVILLPLPSAVELQDSSPLDLSFHRTCILEISILGTPTALRRTLSVHGAPVEGHQDRKDLFFIGCRKDKKL